MLRFYKRKARPHTHMNRYIFLSGILLLLLSACSKEQPKQQPMNFGTEIYDSTALHVALIPNKDCLPIYYAERTGIFKQIGLNIQIASYNSQIDCDTALLNNTADGGHADLIRLKSYGRRSSALNAAWYGTAPWHVFVCSKLRIKDIKGLKERTVGIARHSAENSVLDQAIQKAGMEKKAVFRPQINNMKLRTVMLDGDQIDAAVLTWPYDSWAKSKGHRILHTNRKAASQTCFVKNKTKGQRGEIQKQWELFEKGRQMAIDSLKIKGPKAYSLILQKDYGLPKEVADTIKF